MNRESWRALAAHHEHAVSVAVIRAEVATLARGAGRIRSWTTTTSAVRPPISCDLETNHLYFRVADHPGVDRFRQHYRALEDQSPETSHGSSIWQFPLDENGHIVLLII